MKDFAFTYPQAQEKSAIGYSRLVTLYTALKITDGLSEDIAEAGIFRGGSAYMLLGSSDRKVHLFDSFKGLPRRTEQDREDIVEGRFRFARSEVEEFLDEFSERYTIYEGWFCDTLNTSPDIKYSLVHLDVDLYQSYKECLEFFVPRIVSGGLLVCDDYRFLPAPGATIAIDEYFGDVESLVHWHSNIQLTVRL